MATLIDWTTEDREVFPMDRKRGFTREETALLIGCQGVEIHSLADGRVMVVDEDARVRRHNAPPLNVRATLLYHEGRGTGYAILGRVIVADPSEIQ